MKLLFAAFFSFAVSFAASIALAAGTMKMSYQNAELTTLIEAYSKATGQKFVVDPGVRGKASIYLPEEVTFEEAFNHLSSALALNGFAISKQGDTMVIKSARNIQRDYIETTTERPAMKPERMLTWIYTVKNLPAEAVNRDLRTLVSKDGEMTVNVKTNQMIFSDWSSNLNRVADLMKEIDVVPSPATAKLIAEGQQKREAAKKAASSKETPSKTKASN